MTNQEFYEFQTTVEGSAVSFQNQQNGSTVVTCADGVRILVAVDGESSVLPEVADAVRLAAFNQRMLEAEESEPTYESYGFNSQEEMDAFDKNPKAGY